CFFFFSVPPTTEFSTLSLHDALPISRGRGSAVESHRPAVRGRAARPGRVEEGQRPTRPSGGQPGPVPRGGSPARLVPGGGHGGRSEEHTSELQSRSDLVCRLLLEKKK